MTPAQAVAIPCPECGVELYGRVSWDEGQQLPICPDCGADASVGDVDRLQEAIAALLDKASDPIVVDPRNTQDRYALLPWYLIEGLRRALGPVKPRRPYVSASPDMKCGDPVISGRRITAEHVAGMYWDLGEHLQSEILDAYDLTRSDIVTCCWYVAVHGSRTWRKRWGAWVSTVWADTGIKQDDGTYGGWWSNYETLPLPPTRKASKASTS